MMEINRISALYFSPTGGTRRIAQFVSGEIGRRLGIKPRDINFTSPKSREQSCRFGPDELVIAAIPVYAGRVPNKLLPDLAAKLAGRGTPAAAICVFGNRSAGEAPRELALLLEKNNFLVAGTAAFVCRHAFSDRVGAGRPDEEDQDQMRIFAGLVADKLAGAAPLPALELDRGEIGPYYTPLKADKTPARFLKAKPQTDQAKCTRCGLCAEVCPMGSIDQESAEVSGVCIKCQACVRRCPAHAKRFEDRDFLSHVTMLEQNYAGRAENLLLV